jgi:hypothetical protein
VAGEFATRYRTVSIHYDKLTVIQDGDAQSAGDFVGDGRCGETTSWAPLSPMIDDSGQAEQNHALYTELNDGDSLNLNADFACAGPAPASVEAESTLEDDDNLTYDPNRTLWKATSPHKLAAWNQVDWDEAYTSAMIDDPLDPTATGSAGTPIFAVSPANDTEGQSVNVRYQLTGTATFTHTAPFVILPAPTGQKAGFDLQITNVDAHAFTLRWNPASYPVVGPAIGYRVQWRKVGSPSWSSVDLTDPNAKSFTRSGLLPGALYMVVVSRILAGNVPALASEDVVPLKAATSVGGWTATTLKAKPGTTVKVPLTITDGGQPRKVVVESRAPGTSSWGLENEYLTDGAGHLTVTVTVRGGYVPWRVRVPATPDYAAFVSASRLLVARTSVGGFARTSVSAVAGAKIKDGVTVTPGGHRSVQLMYRKMGTTAWHRQATLTANAHGALTLVEVARKGSYQWRLVVPSAVKFGTAAVSAIRRITGH